MIFTSQESASKNALKIEEYEPVFYVTKTFSTIASHSFFTRVHIRSDLTERKSQNERVKGGGGGLIGFL